MIIDNEKELYACSYKEVITILCFLPDEDWNKIPSEEKDFYFKAMNRDYDFKYDISKGLEEQKLLEPTKDILANIFKKYLNADEEKRFVIDIENDELEDIEFEKRETYPVNYVFNNRNDNNEMKFDMSASLPIEPIRKKSIFEKLLEFINKLLE